MLFFLSCIIIVSSNSLVATHFWDCNGGSCDSRTLQPWNPLLYRYASNYAPIDPNNYGGSIYGEKFWMTGAASDGLTKLLGGDDTCCGSDPDGGGGCGKCLLVSNPNAVQSDWKVLVMKKNRCPPWSNGCEEDKLHLDLAIPGYDNLQFSTANICGQSDTIINKQQSSICGEWYNKASTTIEGCQCDSLPEENDEQKKLKVGCQLFTEWGWKSGNPTLNFEIVECPSKYKDITKNSFGVNGPIPSNENPQPTLYPTHKPTTSNQPINQPTNQPTNQPSLNPGRNWYCNWNNCDGIKQGGPWCNFLRKNCKICSGKVCETNTLPTPKPSENNWYCNWNNCNQMKQGGKWCNAKIQQCRYCGGKVCYI